MLKRFLLGLFSVFALFMVSCGPVTTTNVEENSDTVVKDVKTKFKKLKNWLRKFPPKPRMAMQQN